MRGLLRTLNPQRAQQSQFLGDSLLFRIFVGGYGGEDLLETDGFFRVLREIPGLVFLLPELQSQRLPDLVPRRLGTSFHRISKSVIIMQPAPVEHPEQPQHTEQSPEPQLPEQPVFKGDATSIYDILGLYFQAEKEFYLEYLRKNEERVFNMWDYMTWRFTEAKSNPQRLFLPLVDAVIVDAYLYQNMAIAQELGLNIDPDDYLAFKGQMRDNLVMLDPYLIVCSMTQTPPSYSGYEEWIMYQQVRTEQINAFREELIPLNTVTYEEKIFTRFVSDENNPLTTQAYQIFYSGSKAQQLKDDENYDSYISQVKSSIEGLNLFVFNDLLKVHEEAGVPVTKRDYEEYYAEVLKKYDIEYLKSMHEEIVDSNKFSESQKKNQMKQKVGVMDEDEQRLADEIEGIEIEDGEEGAGEGEGEELEKDEEEKLRQAKQCLCCKGNAFDCEGEVCRILGNCVCLSE